MVGDAHARFLDANWRTLNDQSQAAVFDVAREESLIAAADMRVDGRCTVHTRIGGADGSTLAAKEVGAGSPPAAQASQAKADGTAAARLREREPSVVLGRPAVRVDLSPEGVDGQGSCASFSKGLAAACVAKYGATIETATSASSLLLEGESGRVVGVRTSTGRELRADAVVVCAGACAAPLAASAGVYVPVQPLRGYSLTAPVAAAAAASKKRGFIFGGGGSGGAGPVPPPQDSVRSHVVFSPSALYVTRLGADLRFTCYGEMTRVEADGPGRANPALQTALRALVEREVPNVRELCDWEAAVMWHGSRPLTPDCYPLSGPTRVPGLYLNVGHSFNGWREASLSAQVLADAVQGGAADGLAARAYDPSRFQVW